LRIPTVQLVTESRVHKVAPVFLDQLRLRLAPTLA
jgi:hypothetical protein